MRILLVEDDAVLRDVMVRSLADAGHRVDVSTNVEDADHLWRVQPFDAVLLDLNLPATASPTSGLASGLTALRQARARGDRTPVLVLTARGRTEERIAGLDAGADDYLGKPFDPRELLARIEAVLRRKSGPSALVKDAPVSFGPFIFDAKARTLHRGTEQVRLTGGEFNLLEALLRNAGKPLSRERLLALARDDEAGERNDRAIDIAILRLRRAIEDDPKQPKWIQTVWGIGYRFSPLTPDDPPPASPSLP